MTFGQAILFEASLIQLVLNKSFNCWWCRDCVAVLLLMFLFLLLLSLFPVVEEDSKTFTISARRTSEKVEASFFANQAFAKARQTLSSRIEDDGEFFPM